MASIRKRLARIEVRVDKRERAALLAILDALEPRLGAVPRTRPRAYDDDELEAEYDRLTRPAVEETRSADIEIVREALRGDDNARRLDEDQAYAWIRALNHLRLVAAGLLGVDADGWEESADDAVRERDEYAMLMALGWLQEELVEALATA